MWFLLSRWWYNIHYPSFIWFTLWFTWSHFHFLWVQIKTLSEVEVVLPLDVVVQYPPAELFPAFTFTFCGLKIWTSDKDIVRSWCGSSSWSCCTVTTLRAPPLLNKRSLLPIHSFLPLAEINSSTTLGPRAKVWGRFLVVYRAEVWGWYLVL